MDPQAIWQTLVTAYAQGEYAEAREAAAILAHWLRRGGFPPQTVPDVELDDRWNSTVARTICDMLLGATSRCDPR